MNNLKYHKTTDFAALANCIENGTRFDTTGRLWGFPGYVHLPEATLSPDNAAQYKEDADRITYVVVSYDTPIGWCVDNEDWHCVSEKISKTTSRHQTTLDAALMMLGF